jgi:hypothetical protein
LQTRTKVTKLSSHMANAAYVGAWCKLSTGILPKIDFKGVDPQQAQVVIDVKATAGYLLLRSGQATQSRRQAVDVSWDTGSKSVKAMLLMAEEDAGVSAANAKHFAAVRDHQHRLERKS